MERVVRSDVQAVRAQLRDVLRHLARVSAFRQRHPYGSTVAAETLADVDLPVDRISIPIETDSVPVKTALRLVQNGVLFRVECTLHEVCRGRATYDIELVPPIA